MKYPLTPEAKEAAISLVQLWDEGEIDQWEEITVTGGTFATLSAERILQEWKLPRAGILMELAKYGLIEVRFVYNAEGATKIVQLLFLQELRNAVENDFEVSEYFLNMNAVGTIVQGNLTIHPYGSLLSAASNTGNIALTVEQAADEVSRILGQDFLNSNNQIKEAIDELRQSQEAEYQSKVGKVISQLGNSLAHGANTAQVIYAISVLASVVQHL